MTDRCPVPVAAGEVGLKILKGLARERSLLTAMSLMHQHVGDLFQITLPRFQPVVAASPALNREIMVTSRDKFDWRNQSDPVSQLLRRGLLVQDGESHACLRELMEPMLQRKQVTAHIGAMTHYTDQALSAWPAQGTVDMLVEMRRAALLILVGTLFSTDFQPDMASLWRPILRTLNYISPGLWILWPNMPRLGYASAIQEMDSYLHRVIQEHHAGKYPKDDFVGHLIHQGGLDDELIRDQLLTMLIAGHDTSTALLSWALYLLGQHPQAMARAKAEVDLVLGDSTPEQHHLDQLQFLDWVIKETLRLYPPIHVGNRMAKEDMQLGGHEIRGGTRVMCSIYLSHRHPDHWQDPDKFIPERFDRAARHNRPPFTYIPFGGGPRNCIGASFAQIEAKVVLARILQQFELSPAPDQSAHSHMGATLEPRPGVMMHVRRR